MKKTATVTRVIIPLVHSDQTVNHLIAVAEDRMRRSEDPLHGVDHARRVVECADFFASRQSFSSDERDALRLAGWWHDVSRVMGKKPSLVFMPLVDDFLSACLLFHEAVRSGHRDQRVRLAVSLLLCKSMGVGALFSRFFLTRRERLLLDIFKDADALDILCPDRAACVFPLIEQSRIYRAGYRVLIWWFLSSSHLTMRTSGAEPHAVRALEHMIIWMTRKESIVWHETRFGVVWVEKHRRRADLFLQQRRERNIV